jgi:uncharacterized LabA/DUF88 family protein
MSNKVMVFIDYQNLATCACELYPRTAGARKFNHIDPFRVAECIISRRRYPSELVGVRVYRGRPHPRRQPAAASANDIQAAAWERNPKVTAVRRMLRYPQDFPASRPQEKGIDAALAVDFVWLAYMGAFDVGIIASHDSDLVPALEAVRDMRLAHVEVAGWSRRNRLQFPGSKLPWHHDLYEADFEAVRDDTDYLADRG